MTTYRMLQKRYIQGISLGKINGSDNIGSASIYAGDEDDLELIIGDDFLSAANVVFRLADGHTIMDKKTGEIINRPISGIHIGNHVWVVQ